MDKHQIADLKEQTWEDFFKDRPETWEKAYHAFGGRRRAENLDENSDVWQLTLDSMLAAYSDMLAELLIKCLKGANFSIPPNSPKYDTAIRLLHNCLLDKGPDKRFWAEVESFLEAELDKPPEEAEEKLGWCSCGWVPEPGTVVPWSCPKCDADIQLPISNKPPEPECKHRKKHMKMFENFGERHFKGWSYIYYKDIGDKHCRDCGAKL
ncbi:hypothetical protein LCGC14_1518310 [marine sediment metagenome]|uniref:Uncharacterized protein n=1 Tax=marine sediment metagenome TaxID=412755 RepID=A0A0F9E5I1_9ZZZZ